MKNDLIVVNLLTKKIPIKFFCRFLQRINKDTTPAIDKLALLGQYNLDPNDKRGIKIKEIHQTIFLMKIYGERTAKTLVNQS